MTQLLTALYLLTVDVTLDPRPGTTGSAAIPRKVGLRGEYDCADCDDARKEERGMCPYVNDPQPGTVGCVIGREGPIEEGGLEVIYACPLGLALREPVAREAVRQYHEVQGVGGAAAYYGAPLSRLPARVLRSLGTLTGVQESVKHEIRQTRADMDRR